jgi:hypothetical protein
MKFFVFLPVFLLTIGVSQAETLHYSINWPSQLSLGEATLTSTPGKDQWAFDLDIDASVPGFAVKEHGHAAASSELCSAQLDKSNTHGQRKSAERVTFDQQKNTVTRQSLNGGGSSEISVGGCARDALTFLQFVRKELAQGRVAPQQQVFYGAPYQVRVEFTGQQTIKVGEQQIGADRIVATIKGASSDITVELFFARDPARTPILAKIPAALATFTVELIR